MKKRILIINSGGDCPGMNAVIRAIVKRAHKESDYEIIGSVNSFDGIINEPLQLIHLNEKMVEGIHNEGGTILMTNNNRYPFSYPLKKPDGNIKKTDLSDTLLYNLKVHNIHAVIHIGGNESHKTSYKLFQKGVHIVGVPKTINNDIAITDYAFGFNSAAQVATEAIDRLVTTAESHNRVLILEVMGSNSGWIALESAIAGGADVCLIPEIHFSMEKIIEKLNTRFDSKGRGFAIIVVAEGASIKGYKKKIIPGEIARKIAEKLKAMNFKADIRETILGHLQRGGSPMAFDRILATELGVKAFELVQEEKFGTMVIHKNANLDAVPLEKVIKKYHEIELTNNLIRTARGIGISFGD